MYTRMYWPEYTTRLAPLTNSLDMQVLVLIVHVSNRWVVGGEVFLCSYRGWCVALLEMYIVYCVALCSNRDVLCSTV